MFQPLDKQFARKTLHLPQDKRLILFGAGDLFNPNKGLDLLLAALQSFVGTDNTELIVFGRGKEQRLSSPIHCASDGSY
ncbi:MAG: hypothetical protein Q9P01_04780 [Anaerolineae bacterium]|nr:hypothetical protein [Anaerolineae bacterium]